MVERPGYYWAHEHWVQKGPRWHFQPGRWERHEHWNKGTRTKIGHDRD